MNAVATETAPLFVWSTPAPNINGSTPTPWRCARPDAAATLGAALTGFTDVYAEHYPSDGPKMIWVSVRGFRGDNTTARKAALSDAFRRAGFRVRANRHATIVVDTGYGT